MASRFSAYIKQLEAEAAEIYKHNGLNEEEALQEVVMNWIAAGKIAYKGKQITNVAKNATVLRNGGKVWKGMRTGSETLASTLSKMGLDISKRAAMNVAKGATVVLNAVFIVWDMKSLADSLNDPHAALEPVLIQLQNISELKRNLEALRDSLSD